MRGVPRGGDLGECLAGYLGVGGGPGDHDGDALVYLAEIEGAGTGCVGVAVAAYGLLSAGSLKSVQDFAAAAPVGDACALEVRDDDRDAALATDAEGFVH